MAINRFRNSFPFCEAQIYTRENFIEGLSRDDFIFPNVGSPSPFLEKFQTLFSRGNENEGIEFLITNLEELFTKSPPFCALFLTAEQLESEKLVIAILEYSRRNSMAIEDREFVLLSYWMPKILPVFALFNFPMRKDSNIKSPVFPTITCRQFFRERGAPCKEQDQEKSSSKDRFGDELKNTPILLLYEYSMNRITEEMLKNHLNWFETGSIYNQLIDKLNIIRNST